MPYFKAEAPNEAPIYIEANDVDGAIDKLHASLAEQTARPGYVAAAYAVSPVKKLPPNVVAV